MVWVWPPQISISTQGRVVDWTISAAKGAGDAMVAVFVKILHAAQNSTTAQFTRGVLLRKHASVVPRTPSCVRYYASSRGGNSASKRSHLFEKLVSALGFGRIHPADREADVDHHIVAQVQPPGQSSAIPGAQFRRTARGPPAKAPVPESRGSYRVWPRHTAILHHQYNTPITAICDVRHTRV
jgi:hypothetical protein